ncbi:pseudouridine synthase [Acidovorax carolinensis]|uniref:tRNA pseudouridine synthase C n=1 Tax=Acidovorax carolinensis TaxID=553814 RepID=A0A240UC50_9BURK|nr:pseudouridine synthase [Acidovorax carolinensis]ART58619.1 pseudouridine synthase [Acidovorax carolinensis]
MPPLHILWRDEHLVAVYKPAGWLVHRTGLDAGETRFVMQTLRDQLGQHVYPVHRLDKGTCGVLVMALHSAAARALSQAFEHGATHKRYLAMVRGWAPESIDVDHALKPDDAPADAAVQDAHTRFRRLAQLTLPEASDARFATTRASLVEALPTTGRRHQIRRHLKHLAHPIIGDATHGKGPLNRWWAERLGQQRLWLHAWHLTVPHPVTGAALALDSGLQWPAWTTASATASNIANAAQVDHGAAAPAADWQRLLAGLPWQTAPGTR